MLSQIKNYSYKYGLNIEIKPEIDISIIKELKNIPERVIKLNKEKKLELEIEFKERFSSQKIIVNSTKNTECEIFLNLKDNLKENSLAILNIEINQKENSKITLVQIQKCTNNMNLFVNRTINQEKHSISEIFDLVLGSKYIKQETFSNLNGQDSKTTQTVVYMAKGDQKQDIYTAAIHNSKQTESSILIRGVTRDKAKSLSRSLIKIKENSTNSKGYEKQEALILDETAEANTIPNLEIDNNEVQCSHGSTIGQINEEMLFYLMSRGLSLQQAKFKIIEGYFNPIIDKISDIEIKEKLRKEIEIQ